MRGFIIIAWALALGLSGCDTEAKRMAERQARIDALAAANTAAEHAATTRAREAITKLRAQTDAMAEPLKLEPEAHTLPAPEEDSAP